MKKISIITILIILSINLMGCTNNKTNEKEISNSDEFEVISIQDIDSFNSLKIIKYKKTGEKFVLFVGPNKGGITKLDD
jgi:uncharacterized lipoprotein NlpE involved in copper resistance